MKNNNFRISTHKLAEICGVSQGTVDRALNNRGDISEKTKEKILSVAREYGYMDERIEKPRLIGVVMFDLYNEYFSELIMYMEHEFKKLGYSIVVMFTDKNAYKERKCLRELYYMGVDGIVICPVGEGEEFCKYLKSFKIPIITVGNRVRGISYVGIDNFRAMYEGCMSFSDGSRFIYYAPSLNVTGNNSAQRERCDGFIKAAKDKKSEYTIVHNINELKQVISSITTPVIICPSDYYIMSVKEVCPNAQIMGFDNINAVKMFGGTIKTIDGNSVGVASAVAHNILNGISDDVVLDHKIINP